MSTTQYTPVAAKANKTHGLRTTMLTYFGGLSVGAFTCLLVSLIVTVVVTNENISTKTEVEMENQIEAQAHAMLKESGDYLLQVLQSYDQAVVTAIAETAGNTLRTDYSMSTSEIEYFDFNSSFWMAPLTQDARQIEPVSMGASTFYVTGSTPADVDGGFSAEVIRLRNATNNLDTYLKHAYETNDQVVAMYVGFELSPASLVRIYPGMQVSAESERSYEPATRPWYEAAMANEASGLGTAFTEPYLDSFGKGWMITASHTIQDPSQGFATVGVAGADIVIDSIGSVLDSVNFLDTGKLTLFQADSGQVVSDREWDLASSTDPFFYSDLTQPVVSARAWDDIHSTEPGALRTVKFGGNIAYVYHLEKYEGQYMLVIFVREREIFAPVEETLDDLDQANTTISLTLAAIVLVVFVFLMFVVLLMIDQILDVFAEMSHNVDSLLGNVGCAERNLTDGMVDVSAVSTIELRNMQAGMNGLIASMRQNRADSSGAALNVANPGFGNMNAFNGLVKFTTMSQPDAPPAYNYADAEAAASAVPVARAVPINN
jgi:hypothetical protein